MSIVLFAELRRPVTLANVLVEINELLPAGARTTLGVEGRAAATVLLAPFWTEALEQEARRARDEGPFSAPEKFVVFAGTVARVWLRLRYDKAGSERKESEGSSGYRVRVDAGLLRTKASFCLAVLLVTVIARGSGAFIQDESGEITNTNTEWVDPATVLALFEQHSDATSFEAFADAFCKDIKFSPNWPDSASLVGTSGWRD